MGWLVTILKLSRVGTPYKSLGSFTMIKQFFFTVRHHPMSTQRTLMHTEQCFTGFSDYIFLVINLTQESEFENLFEN